MLGFSKLRGAVRGLASAFAVALAVIATAVPAAAADLGGTWERDSGQSRIKFSACGKAQCGSIVWLSPKAAADGKAKVGQQVFFDMVPNGADSWEGKAFNPEDGKTYTGKMTLAGKTLTTSGCVLGGLICKSATWKRLD